MEEDDDVEEEEEEEDDDDGQDDQSEIDENAGISSVTSTTPSGAATPDALQLRKRLAEGVHTPSAVSTGGLDTPDSTHSSAAPQLYQVLEQTSSKVGAAAFGSSHGYVVPPPPPPGVGTAGGANRAKGGGGGAPRDGIELALDPSELEHLDEGALRQRYEQLRTAERAASAPEDVSDIIEEQERKRRRKQEGQSKR